MQVFSLNKLKFINETINLSEGLLKSKCLFCIYFVFHKSSISHNNNS